MFFLLDGTVSAVLGTGTRVMTSDGSISKKGTAAVTDAGRTGSSLSVGGLDPAIEIEKELNLVPLRSRDGILDVKLQGFILETDEDGMAVGFRPFAEQCEDMENDSDSKSS
jgi:calcineurin-like phosphoesterase